MSDKKNVTITLNGAPQKVEEGATILSACKEAGVEVPVFCSHERLSVAGNCRMCLVEVEGMPKLQASCALPVSEGMTVSTTSERVEKARKGNLELMLINHPLDCPVCDQGGECDLQDITMAYGPSTSRFMDNKRAVADKYMGPLIKTVMTRCIHCTRCIRFAEEVAGVPELGTTGRGEDVEITTYLEHAMTSELSGNVIDLCPVGALNAKPSSCKGRGWEYTKTPSIDVSDALGSHVEVHHKNNQVMRVLPRECPELNEEWLTDKARFSCDGLKYQRLDTPYVRRQGKLVKTSWAEALKEVARQIKKRKPTEMAALVGDLADVETTFALRGLLDALGVESRDCLPKDVWLPHGARADYLFNTPLQEVEKADFCLLVGCNPQVESPLMNMRLRRAVQRNQAHVALVGPEVDLGYKYEHVSPKGTALNKILAREHEIADRLTEAKHPLIILGMGALVGFDGEATYKTARHLADTFGVVTKDWNGFNILHTAAGMVGALDVGFVPKGRGYPLSKILRSAEYGETRFVYLVGRDDVTRQEVGDAFVVYQGHHGDQGAQMADVVLPGLAHTEKQALYVNMEGRLQETAVAVEGPGEAKEDWKIIRALSEMVGHTLPYDTRESLLERLAESHGVFQSRGVLEKAPWKKTSKPQEIRRGILEPFMENYYMSDVICRSSPTMAACVSEILEVKRNRGSQS